MNVFQCVDEAKADFVSIDPEIRLTANDNYQSLDISVEYDEEEWAYYKSIN